ncbi:transporter [Sphingomonas radiodurans]|uniref:transporter n=1 Tax=Sphingomonas radiodurans TaxID=2890321 RepID=UPI001E412713|nr:transporter [Sphingomonas radiodurans]WBH16425.1 transporter [Sphingomonas radiodurans]
MIILLALSAAAAEPAPQSEAPPPERYTLFDPVPRDRLRGFNTDRPDTTESPYTLNAGHLQIELSAAEYTLGRDRSRTLDVLPVNLKLGLLDNVDLQLLFTPYQRVVGDDGVDQGFGDDTLVRLKINLQGNDGEGVALGVMPFIKLPTGTSGLSNGHVEAGLILPMAIDLFGDWSLGAMLEADLVYRDEAQAYGLDLVHSVTLGHLVAGPVSAYVEYVGILPRGAASGIERRYQAIASAGLTLAVGENLLLDAGTRIGFSGNSDRSTIFLGASTRF